MKTKLLSGNHPTVLRRFVRELNNQENGFYVNGYRFNQARLLKGQLQIRAHGLSWENMGYFNHFSDCYGQEIVASRWPKK